MTGLNADKIRTHVRERYGQIGELNQGSCCCSDSTPSCCGEEMTINEVSEVMGYSSEELSSVPEGANLGLGCGNPQGIAGLKPGEFVLDLGCGGGFDAFLVSNKVGDRGMVIGVDMTPEMINRARVNAQKGDYRNVDFRLGEIENLPVKDSYVDVIISNCVINLSPNKQRVFDEAFRVLKNGGRLAISDVVSIKTMPDEIRNDVESYTGCISGAASIDEVKKMLKSSGFEDIDIVIKNNSDDIVSGWEKKFPIMKYVASASIQAKKPMK